MSALYALVKRAVWAHFCLMQALPEKRIALPHSRIMIHQPSGGARGQATDIMIEAEEIARIKKEMNELMAKHSGQSLERIEQDVERDYFLSAEEAKEYGLIDKVLHRTEIVKKEE